MCSWYARLWKPLLRYQHVPSLKLNGLQPRPLIGNIATTMVKWARLRRSIPKDFPITTMNVQAVRISYPLDLSQRSGATEGLEGTNLASTRSPKTGHGAFLRVKSAKKGRYQTDLRKRPGASGFPFRSRQLKRLTDPFLGTPSAANPKRLGSKCFHWLFGPRHCSLCRLPAAGPRWISPATFAQV